MSKMMKKLKAHNDRILREALEQRKQREAEQAKTREQPQPTKPD